MCAAVAVPPISPEKLSFTVKISPLRTTVAKPVAVDAFGGVSFAPLMTAVNVIVAARHCAPNAPANNTALKRIHRFNNIGFLLA